MTTAKRGSPVLSAGIYLVEIGLVLVLVLHTYASKDAAIIVSMLIVIFGMSTAHSAFESMISGLHFVSLMKRLPKSTVVSDDQDKGISAELEGLTEKDTPYTFAHALFGFLLALIGAGKLLYVLFVE